MPPIRGTKRFSLVAGASILWFHHRNLDEIPKSHSLIFDPGLKDVEGGSSIAGLCLKRTFSENTSWNGLRDLGQMCVCLKIIYIYIPASRKVKFYEVFCKRPSFTRSPGLLGFIELSPFSHQCWIWLEPHLKLLMHDWEAFNHLQIIAPNGPFQVAMNSH